MKEIPNKQTLKGHGDYSAYCKVCWRAVYSLWVDDEPPPGTCLHGHAEAHKCPDAVGVAKSTARIRRARELLRNNLGLTRGQMPTEREIRRLMNDGITVWAISDATGFDAETIREAISPNAWVSRRDGAQRSTGRLDPLVKFRTELPQKSHE